MKFFIHAGFHKTASCSFQTFLACYRAALQDVGVYYPDLDGADCHNALARQALNGDWRNVESHILHWRQEAELHGGLDVFISAEDFETFICEPELARTLETIIDRCGFAAVLWFCVIRNPWDYFNALYA